MAFSLVVAGHAVDAPVGAEVEELLLAKGREILDSLVALGGEVVGVVAVVAGPSGTVDLYVEAVDAQHAGEETDG